MWDHQKEMLSAKITNFQVLNRLAQAKPSQNPPKNHLFRLHQTAGKLHAGHEAFTPRLYQYFGASTEMDDFVQFLGSRCSTFRPFFDSHSACFNVDTGGLRKEL